MKKTARAIAYVNMETFDVIELNMYLDSTDRKYFVQHASKYDGKKSIYGKYHYIFVEVEYEV